MILVNFTALCLEVILKAKTSRKTLTTLHCIPSSFVEFGPRRILEIDVMKSFFFVVFQESLIKLIANLKQQLDMIRKARKGDADTWVYVERAQSSNPPKNS